MGEKRKEITANVAMALIYFQLLTTLIWGGGDYESQYIDERIN